MLYSFIISLNSFPEISNGLRHTAYIVFSGLFEVKTTFSPNLYCGAVASLVSAKPISSKFNFVGRLSDQLKNPER